MDDDQWSQAKLPVSTGGIGLRSAEDHAPAAYLTSLMGCQSLRQALLHLTEEDSQLTISAPLLALLSTKQGEDATVDSLLGVTQKAVGLQIDLHNMNLLIDKHNREGVAREIARLGSLSLPHAGDWLHVVPSLSKSPALGLHLRSREFVVSVKYRLGAPVYTVDGQCPACGLLSDKQGDHAISCGSDGAKYEDSSTQTFD